MRRHVGELLARHAPFFRCQPVIADEPRDLGTVVERLAQVVLELRAQHRKKPRADERKYEQRDEREHQCEAPCY